MNQVLDKIVPPKAGRREWVGLAVLALPCFLATMDLTVLNLAVPALSADLKPSSSQLLWIVDIYGFMIAGALITMGNLGDRIGRRRLLLIGAAAFGLTSVLAAFSKTAETLIATRALLGVAGATLAPSTLSLIRNMFLDPQQRTAAISVWLTSFSTGAAIGPLVGGVLLEHFWWGSVFLVSVPVMALLLALGPFLLPEYRDPRAGRLDVFSAVLSLSAVLAMIYGLKRIAEHGWGWQPFLFILAGGAVGLFFARRQRKLADPLIDFQLFKAPAFSASLASTTLGCFAAFGAFLFTAQYLQLVLGLSPLWAGIWSAPSSLGFMVGSLMAPVLTRWMQPRTVVVGGLVMSAAGFALLTQVGAAEGLAVLVAGSVIYSLGLAPVFTVATDIVMTTAPAEKAGAASGISETCNEFGGAMGMAVLGSLGMVVYRHRVSIPEGLSSGAAESARSTLGGALAVANELPEGLRAALLGPAREAFTHALQVTAAVNCLIALVLAMAAAVWLRQKSTRIMSENR